MDDMVTTAAHRRAPPLQAYRLNYGLPLTQAARALVSTEAKIRMVPKGSKSVSLARKNVKTPAENRVITAAVRACNNKLASSVVLALAHRLPRITQRWQQAGQAFSVSQLVRWRRGSGVA